ncbi:hypothetical protein D9756_010718 [Leucocoprinus leucothites]|uniref:Uncharacterized protein n=1 Tax=Leucocoprinus leucothites TaxID=201217 RepID=A0A8H5CVW5_9AGAR|nr:hypothetical protein D9756_010718 [Leucoagaricus leucothites]
MSHQIVEYFTSAGQATSEDDSGSMSGIRMIDRMMSMATAFNSALIELHTDYATSVDISIAQPEEIMEHFGAEDQFTQKIIPLSVDSDFTPEYRVGFKFDPQQMSISLVNAAHSLDDSWRLALSTANPDIPDSVREGIITVFREHSIRVGPIIEYFNFMLPKILI